MIKQSTQNVNSMSGWSLIIYINIFANEKMQTRTVCLRSFGTAHTLKVLLFIHWFETKRNRENKKNEMDSMVKRRHVNYFMAEAHLTTCKHLAPVSRKTHHTSVTNIIIIIMDISSSMFLLQGLIVPSYVFSDVLGMF